MKNIINKLTKKQDLSLDESLIVAEQITAENADSVQVAAILTALAIKGYTVDEITGFAQYGRQHTIKLNPSNKDQVVDIVGTGADNSNTFNISTAAAFVVAGVGVPVAKYGNKAVSSNSGSSDVLEELGINIYQKFDKIESCLEEIGLVFMNAQQFNPVFKYIAPIRKKLGIPTIFNLIGPLTNPVQPKYIAMGIYHLDLLEIVAQAAMNLGYKRGLFFHGQGLDEITTTGATFVAKLNEYSITYDCIQPDSLGINRGKLEDLQVNTKEESASIILKILKGEEDGDRRNIVLLNAAVGIYATGKASDFKEGVELAKESIDSKKALEKLCAVRDYMK